METLLRALEEDAGELPQEAPQAEVRRRSNDAEAPKSVGTLNL